MACRFRPATARGPKNRLVRLCTPSDGRAAVRAKPVCVCAAAAEAVVSRDAPASWPLPTGGCGLGRVATVLPVASSAPVAVCPPKRRPFSTAGAGVGAPWPTLPARSTAAPPPTLQSARLTIDLGFCEQKPKRITELDGIDT